MSSDSTAVKSNPSRVWMAILAILAIFIIIYGLMTSAYLYAASGVALIVASAALHRGVNKQFYIGVFAFYALLGLSLLFD